MVDASENELRILRVMLKSGRYMTTARIAKDATMSWNTADKYLNIMHNKGWLERKGKRMGYWKAIVD